MKETGNELEDELRRQKRREYWCWFRAVMHADYTECKLHLLRGLGLAAIGAALVAGLHKQWQEGTYELVLAIYIKAAEIRTRNNTTR